MHFYMRILVYKYIIQLCLFGDSVKHLQARHYYNICITAHSIALKLALQL